MSDLAEQFKAACRADGYGRAGAIIRMDEDFTGRITYIAQRAKGEGYDDVAAWMQRHLAEDIRAKRASTPRKRGMKVTLGRIRRGAVLDADRIKQLLEHGA